MKRNPSISLKHTKAQWPVSLEELKERRDQSNSEQVIRSGMLMLLFFLFLAANAPLVEWAENQEVASWVPKLILTLLFAVIVGCFGGMIWVAYRTMRAYDLVCPSCGKPLDDKRLMPVAVATGHCGHCGEPLVYDHPSKRLAAFSQG